MSSSRRILLFPCNGNTREALGATAPGEAIGFVDDDLKLHGQKFEGLDVFGRSAIANEKSALVLALPGNPDNYLKRDQLISSLGVDDSRWATVIHPSAQIDSKARIGKNVYIGAGSVIGPGAVIEDHVCILYNSVIHHDSVVEHHTLVGSGVVVAGYVKIGPCAYIGSGSNIIQRISIGERSLVGMGSNVIATVAPGTRVVGNPARPIQ